MEAAEKPPTWKISVFSKYLNGFFRFSIVKRLAEYTDNRKMSLHLLISVSARAAFAHTNGASQTCKERIQTKWK